VYAFGVMLFAFLVANGVGSAIASRLPRAGVALGAAQAMVGVATFLSIPLFDDIPKLFRIAGRYAPSFVLWEGTRFLGAALPLVLPCAFMGAAFALLLRLGGGDDAGTSARMSRIYAANTLGAMIGTLVGTFALAPALGSQRALELVAAFEVGLAAVVVGALSGSRRGVAAMVLAAIAMFVVPRSRWDVALLLSGSNVYFHDGFEVFDRLRFYEEDRAGGLVAVLERGGTRTLIANGKFEGNDGFEVPDQQMHSLLPMLFVRRFDSAVNIGVGTANSLATMTAFPFRRVDAVDLSAAILHAAEREFSHLNGGVLRDPRVTVHVDDGRNFLLTTRQRYDLIGIQMSSIWIAGSAELYSREFYEISVRALAPDGIFQQWVQLHHIQSVDLARVMRTMRTVFPHMFFLVGGHQGVLIGSRAPLRSNAEELRSWTSRPALARLFRSSKLEHPYAALGHVYLDTGGIDRFIEEIQATEGVSDEELLSTDDRPRLEYSTPRGNLLRTAVGDNMERLRRHSTVSLAGFVHGLRDEYDVRLLHAYSSRERGYGRLPQLMLGSSRDRACREGHATLCESVRDVERLQWP
jgi:spermidine synthase